MTDDDPPGGATWDPGSRDGPGPTPGTGDPRDDASRQRLPTVTGRRHGYQVAVECPYCGGEHRHGLTDELRTGGVAKYLAECRAGGHYLVDLEVSA